MAVPECIAEYISNYGEATVNSGTTNAITKTHKVIAVEDVNTADLLSHFKEAHEFISAFCYYCLFIGI